MAAEVGEQAEEVGEQDEVQGEALEVFEQADVKADVEVKAKVRKKVRKSTPMSRQAHKLEMNELEDIVFGKDFKTARRAAQVDTAAGPPGKKRKAAAPPSKAAWEDPDDAALEVDFKHRAKTNKFRRSADEELVSGKDYEQRLREHFVKMNGNARWAEEALEKSRSGNLAEDPEDDSEEDEVPASRVLAGRRVGEGPLPQDEIDVQTRREVMLDYGKGKGPAVIEAVQFHPQSELLLTAGLDRRLSLFAVDGEENPKMSSHHFVKFPISGASFTPNGDEILLTGRLRSEMRGLDVRTGAPLTVRPMVSQSAGPFWGLATGPPPSEAGLRSSSMYSVLGGGGSIVLSDVATKHVIRTMRMSAPGVAAVFSPEKDTLFTADEENHIYEWDLGSGRCLQKRRDPWATKITSLALRRTSRYAPTPLLAVGTGSGNVDIFDASGPKLSKEPVKSIDNLVTRVGCVRFHPNGELLMAASRMKQDALKMVHVGAGTVFPNWPTGRTPLNRVSCFDMSRRAGYLAIGNERGRVLIYQLAHYERGGE